MKNFELTYPKNGRRPMIQSTLCTTSQTFEPPLTSRLVTSRANLCQIIRLQKTNLTGSLVKTLSTMTLRRGRRTSLYHQRTSRTTLMKSKLFGKSDIDVLVHVMSQFLMSKLMGKLDIGTIQPIGPMAKCLRKETMYIFYQA